MVPQMKTMTRRYVPQMKTTLFFCQNKKKYRRRYEIIKTWSNPRYNFLWDGSKYVR